VLEQARTADPDGSVIVLSPIGMLTIFPHVYRNLGYDTFRDYTAAGCTSTFVTAITAGSTLPSRITTLHDLIEWGRSNPQGASYGSPGSGSSMHFVGTMISRLAGNTMTHVPYKGAAPMIQDLLGGQIPLGMVPIGDAVPYVRGGKLRVIATSGPQRSRFLPEVPTTAEAGYPEVVGEEFFALFVPARTPAATVAELNGIINEAVNTPAFQDRLVQMGLESRTASPEQMNAIVRSAYAAWAPIVKASGFTADD
jgi:tripartite-type tricarboxylate transporter receptor subunit TctC